MKYLIYPLSLVLLLLPGKSLASLSPDLPAQHPDAQIISVSDQSKSYLLFDQPVHLVDIGNPALYQASIEGNSVFIIARKATTESTPIYIVTGQKIFLAMLQFEQHPNPFNDFRNQGRQKKVEKLEQRQQMAIQEQFEALQSTQDLNFATSNKEGITFRLSGIIHDLSTTYLKFYIQNQSSVTYAIDFVGFERLERYKKSFFGKEKSARFPVAPTMEHHPDMVLPYDQNHAYVALPLRALTHKETLLITLREKSGNRTITLKIKPGKIRRADLY